MLCQFSFQNFKSYKDETTFDFRAMAIPEFQDALIRQEKAEDLLPVSAVYGPNGGGKTNLLQAFFCLINLVVKPIHALEKNRQPMIFQQGSSVAPFMLDENSVNAVWSNQCVELWYLLHFMYMDTDIDRSRYWPKLSDWLKNIGAGSYEKNRPDMYEVLRPYMDIAIANRVQFSHWGH